MCDSSQFTWRATNGFLLLFSLLLSYFARYVHVCFFLLQHQTKCWNMLLTNIGIWLLLVSVLDVTWCLYALYLRLFAVSAFSSKQYFCFSLPLSLSLIVVSFCKIFWICSWRFYREYCLFFQDRGGEREG